MNSARLLDKRSTHKTQFYFCILAINHLKMKLNNFIYNNIKKNRIVRNKFNRAVKKLHSVKYKISLKEITEDLNKWGGKFHVHGSEDLIL